MPATKYKNSAIVRMADGTVKQKNLLTGTEVWTVPGRGLRPLTIAQLETTNLKAEDHGRHCAFCHHRYLETPPEKSRLVRRVGENGQELWQELRDLRAQDLNATRAEFRRIPNLFEIISYNYWHLNHGHEPPTDQRRRMAEYLSSAQGFDHVMGVVRARLLASGMSEEQFEALDEHEKLSHANGFFSGGHDVIVARRHFIDGATHTGQVASSGTLTPQEHFHYIDFTAQSIADLYQLNSNVAYVAAFQNWLRPAGASFDHLHKQLVAIDEHSVQTESELLRLRQYPDQYDQILSIAASRNLVLAQNDYAVAMAGFGHRFPTVAIWPLGKPKNPWEYSESELRGVSDILHAVHAATGSEVPCNEEWYHRPPDVSVPMRWRILVKWRISTLAGFEGGTRIYLNTIDPWQVRDRMMPKLEELRAQNLIAPMRLGSECKVTPALL